MPGSGQRASRSLCISIVTYTIKPEDFTAMLASLAAALEAANSAFKLNTRIIIVDNGQEPLLVKELCARQQDNIQVELIFNDNNVGYGVAQNQGIASMEADYHLMMNPDVVLHTECLLRALQYLEKERDVVALSPEVKDILGKLQYLCKRYPSVTDLALRGFGPEFLRKKFEKRLSVYECRSMVDKKLTSKAKLISGCFMLVRGAALRTVGGFNEKFFLYFEDFALSIELGKLGKIVYFPQVAIVHYGGHAARKGLAHIRVFVESAWTFFNLYGWKVF
jgi:GT2 family glycosyltransferase